MRRPRCATGTVNLARRLATGTIRARYACNRAINATLHIVAVLAIYRCSTMAQTGVSGPVVVDGESFLDALFASAGQG